MLVSFIFWTASSKISSAKLYMSWPVPPFYRKVFSICLLIFELFFKAELIARMLISVGLIESMSYFGKPLLMQFSRSVEGTEQVVCRLTLAWRKDSKSM